MVKSDDAVLPGMGEEEKPFVGKREEEEETEESSIDLRNYLRDDILEVVDECLNAWEKDQAADSVVRSREDPLHRCVVCTLAHGTCQHTAKWLEDRKNLSILDGLPKDSVDLAMDDISDVFQQAPVVVDSPHMESLPTSLSTMHWETLYPQPADEISGKKVDLSSPALRAGHSMVQLDGAGNLREDSRLLVVFGGVSLANTRTLQKDLSAPATGNELEPDGKQALIYHGDLRLFHVGLSRWHKPGMIGDIPEARYGHVSLALDGNVMWMFGGRLKGGRQQGDTYILDVRKMCWERTNETTHDGRSPAPRFSSAAVKVRDRIVLFGGADLRNGRIFDDVWVWDIESRRWTEQIVVGAPPLARYGHALLGCPDGRVVVLGGCCVSSTAEKGLPEDEEHMQLRVRVAADDVDRAIALEEAQIAVGACASYVELEGRVPQTKRRTGKSLAPYGDDPARRTPDVPERWKNLSRGPALLAAAVAARERNTAMQKEQLRSVLREQAASSYWARLQSRHSIDHLDATFLDTDSMIWEAKMRNSQAMGYASRTAAPSARMHFSAVTIDRKVVVWGGCLPTARQTQLADGDVYVYDLVDRRWTRPLGECHPEGIMPRMEAAAGQVRRAARSLFEAKQRAMTMGAPGGRTVQVIQAEADLEVNRWRVRKLVDEIRHAVPSPRPRAAHTGCAVGHRVMYFGGWGAHMVKTGELLLLDVEQPHEKQRRLEEEFHQRLERERQTREQAEVEALRRTAMQETMRKELEMVREAAEKKEMAAEDARSAIPELTVAPTPRLRCANGTTLWLEWDRPNVDIVGKHPADRVEYTLYMRGGFREWQEGDRVLVEYLSRAARKAATHSSSTLTMTASKVGMDSLTRSVSSAGPELTGSIGTDHTTGEEGDADTDTGEEAQTGQARHFEVPNESASPRRQSMLAPTRRLLLPAVITDTSTSGGLYDIRWDDGEKERDVPRYRIHRAIPPAPPWAIIYRGDECHYAIEGMVPAAVIERERSHPYEVAADFSLQTKGTEEPRDKLSRHSPVVTLSTCFGGQGPLEAGETSGSRYVDGAPVAVLKARLATARALDDSISAGEGSARSLSSGVHPMHGQYTGTGQGRLFL